MEENKFIHFLSKNWQKILLGVLSIACIGVWSERLFRTNQRHSKEDFQVVNQIYDRFQKGEFLAAESIEAVEGILGRHPELRPKYDLLLALTFFSQHKTLEGIHYARSMVERVSAQLPEYYKEYADNTFLIAEKKYQNAFTAALSLQDKLKGEEKYQNLDAMNTLRLFFLAEQLEDETQKKSSWEKLRSHSCYLSLQSVFQEGVLSLSDYSRFKSK